MSFGSGFLFETRSTSAPPILESMLFAYPFESLQSQDPPIQEPHTIKRVPSDSSLIVKKVVNDGIEDDDFEAPVAPMNGYPLDILYYTKEQMGCRMLQSELDTGNPYFQEYLFQAVLPHIIGLMKDPFGNYLCQKLIERCSECQLYSVLDHSRGHVVEVALSHHGTRVVQKLVEVAAKLPCLALLLEELCSSVSELAKDANGNHVIQKCLSALSPKEKEFIFKELSEDITDIGTHRYGCCVLQRCIDASSGDQQESLILKIVEKSVELVQDAYGNYVVQYILGLNLEKINGKLAVVFTQRINALSRQKFSSNVIEKCLQSAPKEPQEGMIVEITKNLPTMLGDQYANYVVQRALQLASPSHLKVMLKAIRTQVDILKSTQVGKRIYNKLVKTYPSLGV